MMHSRTRLLRLLRRAAVGAALGPLAPGRALADPPPSAQAAPADFARELIVTVAALGPHDVPVPEVVYRTLTRPDRSDLCVFDDSGSLVPFAWLTESPRESVVLSDAPIYRVPHPDKQGKTSGLVIERTESGSLLVRKSAEASQALGSDDILVDLGEDAEQAKVTLEWELPPGDKIWHIELTTSDDLVSYRAAGTWALTNISPEHRRIEVSPPQSGRYLRLAERSTGLPSEVRLLRAGLARTASAPPASISVILPGSQTEVPGVYRFHLEGQFPWMDAALHLRAPGARTEGELLVVSGGGEAGRQLLTGAFGGERPARRAPVPQGTRILEARFADKGSARTAEPELHLEYARLLLRFSPSGMGAHHIAFGSARARCEEIASLLGEVATVRVAAPGPVRELSGASALVPSKANDHKTWLLWGALIASVLGLSALAFRLAREMRKNI